MIQLTDKQQRTFLNLALNSIEVKKWCIMRSYTGIIVNNDFQKVRYALDPKHWITNLPVALFYNAPQPSPESKVRILIKRHFDEIREVVAVNDWVLCDQVFKLKNGKTLVSFNLTGQGSYDVTVDLPSNADPYVSCHQIIDAAEEKITSRFKSLVKEEVISNIRFENAKKLFNSAPQKRTSLYQRMYHEHNSVN